MFFLSALRFFLIRICQIEFYIDQLIDRKIIGATTGVTAIINQVLRSENSENGNLTLYISYMSSGVEDSTIKVFAEILLLLLLVILKTGIEFKQF